MKLYFHPLNSIRFVLAIGVLLFHYGTAYWPFSSEPLKTIIEHSAFRVSFFFFISGFVMTLVYQPSAETLKPVEFYMRRITRIMPVYWIAFVITLLLVVLVKGAAPKGLVIALHALGLQSWNPGYVLDLNFTTWSVSVELFFYAIFPFILKPVSALKPLQLLLLMLLVWVLQSWQHIFFIEHLSNGSKKMEEFISDFPLWHLGTFLWGMACARLIQMNAWPAIFQRLSTGVFIAALFGFFYLLFFPNPILKYVHNGILSPLFLLTVLGLYYDNSPLRKFLSLPAVSGLGDLSYGIFVFQYPVWIVYSSLFSDSAKSSGFFFLAYLVTVIVVAKLVSKYLEKPLMHGWRQRLSKSPNPFN